MEKQVEEQGITVSMQLRDYIYVALILISGVGVFFKSQSDISMLQKDVYYLQQSLETVQAENKVKFNKQDQKLEEILKEIKLISIKLANIEHE